MSGQTAEARKKFGELLLSRCSYPELFRKTRLRKNLQTDFYSFLDSKYLVDADQDLPKRKEPSPFLLHDLLKSASSLYKRTFVMSEDLEIPFRGAIRSPDRFASEFDPLVGTVVFPPIKEEFYWLAGTAAKNVTQAVLEQYRVLRGYSVPVFHDVLHAVLYALIPFREQADFGSYLIFIEAVVLPLEAYVNAELGHELYNVVSGSTGAMWHRRVPGDARKVDIEANFRSALVENILDKSNHSRSLTRQWLPKYLERTRHLRRVTRSASARGYSKFKIPDFSLRYLKKEDRLVSELWHWYRETFRRQ